ncbi:MAG TPA: hypothetical protein VJ023_16500 [Pyrinomonadaceae bacterium]|nr:hypothetical protein [Pyrinomonadaceae bacterium]
MRSREREGPLAFKLVSRQLRAQRTVVRVGRIEIGNGEFVVMAGHCSVESREQLIETARAVKAAGASILRGGAYKPRTSPYDFQGLGVEACPERALSDGPQSMDIPAFTRLMSALNRTIPAMMGA